MQGDTQGLWRYVALKAPVVGAAARRQALRLQEGSRALYENAASWRLTKPLRALAAVAAALQAKGARGGGEDRLPHTGAPAQRTVLTPGAAAPQVVPAGLSVVVPSCNGGAYFAALLDSLRAQKGFAQVEIVVVDSGSTDDTVRVAKGHDVNLIEIPNCEFGHAKTRNLGAQNAHGEYLLFMTQDALPTGQWWARRLLHPVVQGQVDAVSCLETPRKEAELYYRIGIWAHDNRLLGLRGQDRVGTLPAQPDVISLQQNAGLSDVACGAKTELFLRSPYRGEFAEDLDFGIRLLRGGGKTGLLSTEKVIHSHNRTPFYCLKRAYTNKLAMGTVLPDMVFPQMNFESFAVRAVQAYCLLGICEFFLVRETEKDTSPESFVQELEDFLAGLPLLFDVGLVPKTPPAAEDAALGQWMEFLWQHYPADAPVDIAAWEEVLGYWHNSMRPYLQDMQYHVPGVSWRGQVHDCFVKAFCNWMGTAVDEAWVGGRQELEEMLRGGV